MNERSGSSQKGLNVFDVVNEAYDHIFTKENI